MTTISLSQKSVKVIIAAVAAIVMLFIAFMAFRVFVPSTRDKVAIPDNLSAAEWNGKMAAEGYYPLNIADDPTNLSGDSVIMPYGGAVLNTNYYAPYEAAEKMSLIGDISVTNCDDNSNPMKVAEISIEPEQTSRLKLILSNELEVPLNLLSKEGFEKLEAKEAESGGILAHYGKIREGKSITVSGPGMSRTEFYDDEYQHILLTDTAITTFALIAVDLETGKVEAARVRYENAYCLY